jgi:hypothetical protein
MSGQQEAQQPGRGDGVKPADFRVGLKLHAEAVQANTPQPGG